MASDGSVSAIGDAPFLGSMGGTALNLPIVGMAPTPTAGGYWLVASDGGIFSFGDAAFHGSTGAIKLNRPIVGMAPTPSGGGYWLVASDGGVFSFGDAAFHGSTGDIKLNQPIVGMASTPSGLGYWLVASDGGIFSFGDASFLGSPAGAAGTIAAMVPTRSGAGYRLVERNGRTWAFGDAPAGDRSGALASAAPVVGIADRPLPPGSVKHIGPSPDPAQTTSPTTAPATTPTTAPATGPATAPPDSQAIWPMQVPPGEIPPGTNGKPDAPVWPTCASFGMVRNIDAIGNGGGEISGLAISTKYPGVLWAIRDSGHTPSLHAIRLDSSGIRTMLREIPIPDARNNDWESLNYTIGPDGRGRLWAVESGQGGRNPSIYEIAEPDPDVATSATLLGAYPYAYPDQRSNTEASFMDGNKLVLVKKSTPTSKLYRFDAPLVAGSVNVPTSIGGVVGAKSVSVVRLSADRQVLMSASHDMLWVHRSADGSGSIQSFIGQDPVCAANAWPESVDNIEAGVILDSGPNLELLFISESRNTYRLSVGIP